MRKPGCCVSWTLAALGLLIGRGPVVAQSPPPPAPPRVVVGPGGLTIASADGQHQLRLRGYVHADGRFSSSELPVGDTATFLMRRVRPILEATMFDRFQARIMPDFGEGRVTLQDAYLEARFLPLARVRFGKFKSPFGLERLASATELMFAERAAPTVLAPNRDVGIMLHGQASRERWSYAIALSNGVPDGASSDADTRTGKDVVARVFVRPFGAGLAVLNGLGVGVALSSGRETGSPNDPGLASLRSSAQQVFFRFRSDGTNSGTTVAHGDRTRTSIQANWYSGPVGAMVERTRSRQALAIGGHSGELTSTGWTTGAGVVLTGEQASARGVSPRKAFDPDHGQWGALEADIRVSRLEIDRSVFPRFADPAAAARAAREWAFGANWYLNTVVKISASFHHTKFDGGAPVGDRPAERLVLSRMQFSF